MRSDIRIPGKTFRKCFRFAGQFRPLLAPWGSDISFSIRVDNFDVMDNHFHLLVAPSVDHELPEVMKWLQGVFTMKYNTIFGKQGEYVEDVYFYRPVGYFAEYYSIMDYIDANPVKAFLVEKPYDWPWSGVSRYRSGNVQVCSALPPWLPLVSPVHCQIVVGAEIVVGEA